MQGLALYNAVIRIVEKISWKRMPDVLRAPDLMGYDRFPDGARLENMPGENLFSVRPKRRE